MGANIKISESYILFVDQYWSGNPYNDNIEIINIVKSFLILN